MSGGTLVTGLNISTYNSEMVDGVATVNDCSDENIKTYLYKLNGPLLNPALALG